MMMRWVARLSKASVQLLVLVQRWGRFFFFLAVGS
jgi:hypothetical protein